MRKFYPACVKAMVFGLIALLSMDQISAQQITIAASPTSSSSTITAISTSSTADRRSRTAWIYPSSVLSGIPSSSLITKLALSRTGTTNFVAGNNLKIYLANTALSTWGSTALTWDVSAATLVYNDDPSAIIGNTAGFKEFTLTGSFTYTGQNLVLYTEYTQSVGITAISWEYNTNTQQPLYSADQGKYTHNATTTVPTTLSTSTSSHPIMRLDYEASVACNGTPTAGTVTKSPSTGTCASTSVILGLTGSSTSTGLSYTLLTSSTSNGVYSQVGSVQASPSFSVTPSVSAYYRMIVTCTASGLSDTTVPEQVVVYQPMAGNFTINASFATGGSNFQSFTDAVTRLNCGISGPVTFTVAQGTGPYIEQITIPQVTGASATNRITFKGNMETLSHASTNSATRAAIVLNGADYVTIDSLIIDVTSGTYGWGIQLMNQANFNIISNNDIRSNLTSTSTSNFVGIHFSASTTTIGSAGFNGSNNQIINNIISGGYNCINMAGSSTAGQQGVSNTISNNIIRDAYSNTLELTYQTSAVISNNDITKAIRTNSTTTAGVYVSTGVVNSLIEKNKVHNFFDAYTSTSAVYAFYNSADGTSGNENKFYNNTVYNINGNGTQYGFYNTTAPFSKYYHNTVVLDNPSSTAGTTYGFYQTGTPASVTVRNNIFVVSRAGTGIKRVLNYAEPSIVSNNNVLWLGSTTGTNNFLASMGSIDFETLGEWQEEGYDLNSINADPLFVNSLAGDLNPTNPSINNIGANLGIATDIEGVARTTTPDPGAYEFSLPPCSSSVIPGVVITASPVVCASSTFQLDLINNSFGEGQLYQWQSSIDSSSWTNLGTASGISLYTATQTGTLYYRAQVTCGTTTLNTPGLLITSPGLRSGNFTIDNNLPASSTNFNSFNAAIEYIKCGINGPVVFEVAPTLFNERVVIPAIPGTSAVNTITFNAHNATLANSSSVSGTRAVLLLDGADYITIDSLNIDATGGTYGWGIQLTGQANNNTIKNSSIVTEASSTSTNFAGIVISGSLTTATTAGDNANNTTISNNTINGGYYAITVAGLATTFSTNNKILNNTLTNFYGYGVYVNNQSNVQVKNNDISRANRTTGTTFYGLYLITGLKSALIEANRIHNSHDQLTTRNGIAYGIYLTAAATLGFETKIVNNLIYNMNSDSGTIYGIYMSAAYVKAYHNTISLDHSAAFGGTATTYTYGFYLGNQAGVEIKNNVVSITRGGTTTKYGLYSLMASPNTLIENNDDVYVRASNSYFGYSASTARPTLTTWQTATGQGANTFDKNPGYISPATGDYTPTSPYLDNSGASVGVTTDILGVARPVNAPDMGAYEFSVPFDVIPPSINYTPLTFTCSTGDRVLSGVTISDLSGVPLTGSLAPRIYFRKGNDTWNSNTGTLTSGDAIEGVWSFTITSALMTNLSIGDTIQYYIIAQDSAGNVGSKVTGVVATNVGNVTTHPGGALKYTISVLNGVYTVGTGGNFPTLTTAVNAYNNSCLTGPVVFSLLNATYSEGTAGFVFNQNPTASATNTLTLKPATGVNTSISMAVASGPIIRILGSYITIDGSNNGSTSRNLTIANTSATSPSVLNIASSGTSLLTNVTVQNTNIINGSATSTAVVIREAASGYGFFKNIVFNNNSVQKSYHGLYVVMQSAAGNGKGLTITNNTLNTSGTNALRYTGLYVYGVDSAIISGNQIGNLEVASGENDKGIWLELSTNTVVSNNTISNLGYTGTGAFAPYGIHNSLTSTKNTITGNVVTNLSTSGSLNTAAIYLNGANTLTRVEKNKVSLVTNSNTTGFGAYGIWLNSSSATANDTVINNFVSDIASYGSNTSASNGIGINVSGGAGYSIFNNTVKLSANQTVTGLPSAFHVGTGVSAAGAINLRNNIFVNTQTLGTERYAIYSAAASNAVFAAIDYNDYWTAGPNLGYLGSNRIDITAIQAGFGGNVNSVNIRPVFVSANDLHIDPPTNLALNDKGIAIAGVTTDIDNETRAVVPDVGADEFSSTIGVDAGVLFQVLPITKTCYSNAETVSVRIRNFSASALDFTTTPVTVNATVSGPNATTFTPVVINTGSLQPGDSLTVIITNSYNMSAAGTYVFNANTVVAGDANAANNAMTAASFVVSAVNAGTITSTRTNYCLSGGTPTLTATGTSNYSSLQWEQSPSNSGPWTAVGTGTTSYTPLTAITSTMYYKLTATCGLNTATSNVVTVLLENPQVLTSTGATRCGTGTVDLSATGSAGTSLNWYATPNGGSPIGSGPTFTTPSLTDTTTFYVAATTGGPTYNVGALNTTIGTAAAVGGYYVTFHVLTPVTLQTVDVFWSGTVGAPYSIIIRDSASGATVSTHNGNITISGTATPQIVDINSYLVPGVYQIGFATNPGTYRNSTGASYPYTVPGVLSITSNTFNNNNYYYYYYNWKIGTGCETPRTAVVAAVNHPVTITTQPANQTVCEGNAVTFNVAVSGTTPMAFEWKKNGLTIAGATTSTYTINNVSFADVANYSVIVTNTCNAVASVSATLTVNANTVITTEPAAQVVCAGNNATFSVIANGVALTYQWRKAGINITGANSASYTITGATTADAANYDVLVSGTCGNDTSVTVSLTVNANTTITTQPVGQVVCAGSPINLSVSANGTSLTYQWRKNTAAIAGATSATYSIASPVAADGGSYDVIVTGSCGAQTSTAVTVTVNPVTAITTHPVSVAVCPSASASFSVTAAGTGLTYQWKKNGADITGATSSTYTISSVAAGDAANYTVVVTGTCGAATSNAAALTVNTVAAITTQPTAQATCPGAAASFSVTATGTGLTYQWRKNTVAITGATSATYSIASATAGDAGSYDVVITGTCGNVTSTSVALTINTPVTITTQPVALNICALNMATFTVAASGSGTLTYQWRKGGTPITGATSATFTITSASVADGGNYDVVVTGACGGVTSTSVVLTVNACTALPSVDANVTAALLMPNVVRHNAVLRVVVGRAMKIDWTITDASGRKVMTFAKQMSAGQSDMTLNLDKLASGTYYLNATTSRGKIETIRFIKL
jgi:trimeric autotransporter adhesin